MIGSPQAEDARWFRREGRTVLITQAMLDRRDALRVPPVAPARQGMTLQPRDVA